MDEVNETQIKVESRVLAFKNGFNFKPEMCKDIYQEIKKNKGEKEAEEWIENFGGKWRHLDLRFLKTASDHLVLDLPLCFTSLFIYALVSLLIIH